MIKSIGQSLVHAIRDQFTEFSQDDYHRVFLWDEGHGYPDESGVMTPLESLTRPFCLVQVAENEAEQASLGSDGPFVEDRYEVRVLVFCRQPPDDPYEHETLPERIKFHFATTDVEVLDYDESPPATIATVSAERVVMTRATGRDVSDALFRYRATVRMSFVFYREA